MNEFNEEFQRKPGDPPDFKGSYLLEGGEADNAESYNDIAGFNSDYVTNPATPNWVKVKIVHVEERQTTHKNPKDRMNYLLIVFVTVDGKYKQRQTYFKQKQLGALQRVFDIKKLKNSKQLLGKELWVHLGLRDGTGAMIHQKFADIDAYSLEERGESKPSFGQGEDIPF